MDPEITVTIGCLCIGVGFAIRYIAEFTTWGKDMSADELKSRIFIGYGAMIVGGIIGALLIASVYGA